MLPGIAVLLLAAPSEASADPPTTPPASGYPGTVPDGVTVPGLLLEQITPGRVPSASWSRSSAVGVRITDTAITTGKLPACNLRLQRADASPSDRPLLEWVGEYDPDRAPSCSGIAPSGTYDLSGPWASTRTRLELRASSDPHPTEPGRLLAYIDLGVDDDPPTMRWPDTPDWVVGGTRVKVLPEWSDLSGVWGTGTDISDDLGNHYVFEQQGGGTLVVPPGRTIVVDEYLTDAAGNIAHGHKEIHGLGTPVGPVLPPTTGGASTARTPAGGCGGSRVASLSDVTWKPRTRRLAASGCRVDRRTLRLQVQVRRRGTSSTRTYGLAAGGHTFSRTVRLVAGARPLRVRVGRANAWGPWRRASAARRG